MTPSELCMNLFENEDLLDPLKQWNREVRQQMLASMEYPEPAFQITL